MATPPLDRTTRAVLAIAAVAGLALALVSAATGSPVLASVAAVCSATAAMIAIVVARRASKTARPSISSARLAAVTSPPPVRIPSTPEGAFATRGGTVSPVPVPAAPVRESGTAAGGDALETPDPADADAVVRWLLGTFSSVGRPAAAHLWLHDPATKSLRLIVADGTLPPAALPVKVDETVLGRALTTDSVLFESLDRVRTARPEKPVWRLAVPLIAGESQGVAGIDFSGGTPPAHESAISLGKRTRLSLNSALALWVASREAVEASVLLEAALDLGRLLDAARVPAVLVERAVRLAGASTASVMLVDEETGGLTLAASLGLPDDGTISVRVGKEEGIAGWVFTTGKPIVVEDLPGTPFRSRRHGVRSALCVPIADDSKLLGVLNVGSDTFAARRSDRALRSLEILGRLGAVAMLKARAFGSGGDLYLDTLKTLALALETKDPYAHGGSERVAGYAMRLADAVGLPAADTRALEIAALLHDIGMVATGDATAVRDRALTTVEWGLVKMHPVLAAELLEQAPTLKDVAPIVFHHHEHYDGSGYASGVAGEQIPLAARILSVADAYVAMTSPRPYRGAMSAEDALAEMTKEAGAQFDPHVVEALQALVPAERTGDPARCV